MTTEELHHFNVDNEELKIVKGFVNLGSIINPNGNCSQEIRRLRLRRAAMKKLEKIKYKDISLKINTKTLHMTIFLVTM